MLDPQFWQDKHVLVTGHTGFKGSWLCLMLADMGAKVTGYALEPPTHPSLFEMARLSELVDSVQGDVRDLSSLMHVCQTRKPEIVLHLAAQPLVRRSYREPVETYATNVLGTVHVLEAVRQTACARVVVNVTSDKCYQNRETVWGYRENEPVGGHDPYSNSKGCSELVTAAYRSSYFSVGQPDVALASARAGNVIGGGDWAEDRLIPDCLKACVKGQPIPIRNPHAIRPWQLVLEPLGGYLVLAQKLWEHGSEYAQGWNFGPHEQDARPVQHIVQRLTELWGGGASWQLMGGEHPHEAHYLKLDCSQAHARLGWFPRTDLDYALRSIVEWTRRYQSGDDTRAICLDHIHKFFTAERNATCTSRAAVFAKAS